MAAVLLLAYRRWQNIEAILDLCRAAGISPIYLHIDGGRTSTENADTDKTLQVSNAYKDCWGIDIRIVKQSNNLGCAISMLASLNSAFLTEEEIIILEDDCIPSPDFFRYMEDSFAVMSWNPSIALACGAQFAPPDLTGNHWMLSRYPLNWGWGISKSQWNTLSSKILKSDKLSACTDLKLSRQEKVYWDEGSRRALAGYTDVWDTLLVREVLRHNLYSILPAQNLVTNVGNDAHALHTRNEEEWTNYPTGKFTNNSSIPLFNEKCDSWMRDIFYRISIRHIFSTKITRLRDINPNRRMRIPLENRIQSAKVNFTL
jgi:hypothetical protein